MSMTQNVRASFNGKTVASKPAYEGSIPSALAINLLTAIQLA